MSLNLSIFEHDNVLKIVPKLFIKNGIKNRINHRIGVREVADSSQNNGTYIEFLVAQVDHVDYGVGTHRYDEGEGYEPNDSHCFLLRAQFWKLGVIF